MAVKREKFSEWYSKILQEAELVDIRSPVKGMPVYRAWGMAIHRNLMNLLEQKLKETGHEEYYFPIAIPEDVFAKEAEHIKGFEDEVFWITHGGLEKLERKLCLRPTSETIMYYMFSIWIRSWRDLPLKVYQTTTVYRYETKATKPLLRGREILWNEAHTAHATQEEAEENVKEAVKIYMEVFRKCGIEPFVVKRPEWDKFAGAVYSLAFDIPMPDGRLLQVGTDHYLGENFARAFGITYKGKDEEEHYVHQTCYGMSMRAWGGIISVHGDEKGLVLPPALAPKQVVIVPILYKGKEQVVLEYAREIERRLHGLRILVDDNPEKTAGWKFNYWEMKGVPVRIEVGPRDAANRTAVIARRDTGEKITVKLEDVRDMVEKILAAIEHDLLERFRKWRDSVVVRARSLEEVMEALENGKAVWIPVCDPDNEKEAEKLKGETGAKIGGTLWPKPEKADGEKCVICGKPAKVWVLAGRYY